MEWSLCNMYITEIAVYMHGGINLIYSSMVHVMVPPSWSDNIMNLWPMCSCSPLLILQIGTSSLWFCPLWSEVTPLCLLPFDEPTEEGNSSTMDRYTMQAAELFTACVWRTLLSALYGRIVAPHKVCQHEGWNITMDIVQIHINS